MSTKKILLVEDDTNFGLVLKDYLEINNFEVTLARDGIMGLNLFKSNNYDIIILDVMMPKKDGFSLAADIRAIDKVTPIIFLTAKALKDDVIKGYQSGADDYIIKPFDSEILLHKIYALLNRKEIDNKDSEIPEVLTAGNCTINTRLRELKIFDKARTLSPKEIALLALLFKHKNDLVKRTDALLKIWKDDSYFTARSMDVYMAKIRKYIKEDPSLEIINIHGEGFRLIEKQSNNG
ncbi:MAG: response regulator transcription factor [Thermaurantimonas sp.]|uniref:Transcriptional regulator n=1 Tax=Thermaurantimonas aggregans TaxID=2173829 RepID=A0A401XHV9_9FLAO|nr:response regulator transcription factor [Thermaurantimonas aggregans]GCD76597.1 transcriptional regulator [Thermaurantimonas aggregans]